MRSLRELLHNLAVPGYEYESEYILVDAKRLLPSERVIQQEEYRTKIDDIETSYRFRVQILADQIDDPELLERLHEAEETRRTKEILQFVEPDDHLMPPLDTPFVPPSMQDGHSDVVTPTDES